MLIDKSKYSLKRAAKIAAVGFILVTPQASAFDAHNENGLMLVESQHFDKVLVADSAKLPSSNKIFIEFTQASFSKEWLDKFKFSTNKRYRESTLERYADMLADNIRNNLTSAGWVVINEPQDDALSLVAHLKDLYITAPDTGILRHALVNNAGKSSIQLEVKGIDNKLFLSVEDSGRAGNLSGNLFETERSMNYSMFRKLTNKWAKNFSAYLNITVDVAKEG